jgi:hypothetical protein
LTFGDALREIERLQFRVRMLEGRVRAPLRRCPYCGEPTKQAACPSHQDLAAIERSAA